MPPQVIPLVDSPPSQYPTGWNNPASTYNHAGARTETTINNPRDFSLGKRLGNLPKLRQVGFQANRCLLEVQRLSPDPSLGEAFQQIHQPLEVNGQRVPALRSTDPRVLVLWSALVLFRLLPSGFASRDFRQHLVPCVRYCLEG